jgi:hypothetical protein
MWRIFKKSIKRSDIFGYPTHLNFDTKMTYGGIPTHNTLLGGICSFVAIVLMFVMFLVVMQNNYV